MSLIKLAPKEPLEKNKYIYTESLNNMSTKTWQEEFENTYPFFPQPQKDVVINFIERLRKHDEAELIKMLPKEMEHQKNESKKMAMAISEHNAVIYVVKKVIKEIYAK